jgi:hypothetical protein
VEGWNLTDPCSSSSAVRPAAARRRSHTSSLAELRVVQCHTDPVVARDRFVTRASSRSAHADDALRAEIDDGRYFAAFQRLTTDAPSIDVDTTAGYDPTLDEIVAFIDDRRGSG